MNKQELENINKAQLMHSLMLTESGIDVLSKFNVYPMLLRALSLQDLVNKGIYFNVVYSPLSVTHNRITDKVPPQIISIDANSLNKFFTEEVVAMLLHEIGHAVSPNIKGEAGEYNTDDYAVNRGFGTFIVSSLETGVRQNKTLLNLILN